MNILLTNSTYPEKQLWLDLPFNDTDIVRLTGQLAALTTPGEDVFDFYIDDVDTSDSVLRDYFFRCDREDKLSHLNQLVKILNGLNATDYATFIGALGIAHCNGSEVDLTAISESLSNYTLLPGIKTSQELGMHLVESGQIDIAENVRKYVDYAKIGDEYISDNKCAFTYDSFVFLNVDVIQERSLFMVELTSSKSDYYTPLYLPASESRLKAVALKLNKTDIDECEISTVTCLAEPLSAVSLPKANIHMLNDFAAEVNKQCQTDDDLLLLCAVLDAECPDSLMDAAAIARNLGDYELFDSDISSAHDYGYYLLYEQNDHPGDFDFEAEVQDYIDFDAYGASRMRWDGIRETSYGMVRRISTPFEVRDGEYGMNMR